MYISIMCSNPDYFKNYYRETKENLNKRRLVNYYKKKYNFDDDEKVEFFRNHKKIISVMNKAYNMLNNYTEEEKEIIKKFAKQNLHI